MNITSIKILHHNDRYQNWQYIKDGKRHTYHTDKGSRATVRQVIRNPKAIRNQQIPATWVYCDGVQVHRIDNLYLPLDYDNPIPNLTKFYKLLLLQE